MLKLLPAVAIVLLSSYFAWSQEIDSLGPRSRPTGFPAAAPAKNQQPDSVLKPRPRPTLQPKPEPAERIVAQPERDVPLHPSIHGGGVVQPMRRKETYDPPKRLLPRSVPMVWPDADPLGLSESRKKLEADFTPCLSCTEVAPPLKSELPAEMISEITKYLKIQIIESHPLPPLPKVGVAPDSQYSIYCKGFVKADGELGEWGEMVAEIVETNAKSCLLEEGGIDLSNICKNFHLFSDKRKKHYYASMFAAMAQLESSCEKDARVMCENGMGTGLLMLEEDPDKRSFRPEEECHPEKKKREAGVPASAYTIQDPRNTILCSVATMRDMACGKTGRKFPRGRLDDPDVYWEKMIRDPVTGDRAITKLIKAYPDCNKIEGFDE